MNDAQWIIQVYEISGDAVLKADGEGIRLRFLFGWSDFELPARRPSLVKSVPYSILSATYYLLGMSEQLLARLTI